MKSDFDILISFRTPEGFKVCGQYFLGKDRTFAEGVFSGLTGRKDQDGHTVLQLDLMETVNDIPVKVKTISCKLSELCGNCQHITRELFRMHAIAPD